MAPVRLKPVPASAAAKPAKWRVPLHPRPLPTSVEVPYHAPIPCACKVPWSPHVVSVQRSHSIFDPSSDKSTVSSGSDEPWDTDDSLITECESPPKSEEEDASIAQSVEYSVASGQSGPHPGSPPYMPTSLAHSVGCSLEGKEEESFFNDDDNSVGCDFDPTTATKGQLRCTYSLLSVVSIGGIFLEKLM